MSSRQDLLELGAGIYKEQLSNKGMTDISVPEFNRSFFCPPALDVGQRQRIQKLIDDSDIRLGAQVIVFCAKTEENDPIFKDSDVSPISAKWDPKLVDRIASQFLDIVMPKGDSTVDDAIKNSKAIQKSTPGSGSQKKEGSQ